MLHSISMFGGLLLMMGNHSRSESLFYYFRLEDQVPENDYGNCCSACGDFLSRLPSNSEAVV